MVQAYVLVSVEAGKNEEVVSALRGIGGVKQAHVCWGVPDIFSFVEAADVRSLADTILTQVQAVDGVRSTQTHIALEI